MNFLSKRWWAIVVCVITPQSSWAVNDPDKFAGDVAQVAVPLAALAATYYHDDSEGRWQWLKSFGSTVIATQALKYAANQTSWGERPNGGKDSFPSGHTSSACSGGFFLQRRYGWAWGAPALAAAAFTGYSRVDEKYHHVRDVVAGCALGWTTAWLFVDRYVPESVSVMPEVGNGHYAMTVSWRFR